MRKQKGFSLIELLIVVAIILIIAAIAIPSLLRSRMLANQSAAASTIRTINTAQVTYLTTYPLQGYAPTLIALGPGAGGVNSCPAAGPTNAAACLIDGVLGFANPTPKQGYMYLITPLAGAVPLPLTDYIVAAAPLSAGTTGSIDYCSRSDLVIKSNGPPPAAAPVATQALCDGYPAIQN